MMNTNTANLFRLQSWAIAIVWCGVAANDVVGLEVTEGQIVTEIYVGQCSDCTGDGVETVTIRSETSNYDIERSATRIIEEFGVEIEIGRVDLEFEHSPTLLRIDGGASGTWDIEGFFVESSVSGTVDFTLDGVRPTEIVRWYGELASAQLAKRNGQVVFTCENPYWGPPRCYSPDDTDLNKQEFLLPAGEYRLTFSAFSYYEAGNGIPGILHFEMMLVPEPSTCIGALTGTLLCCWASRHSRRSRRVRITT